MVILCPLNLCSVADIAVQTQSISLMTAKSNSMADSCTALPALECGSQRLAVQFKRLAIDLPQVHFRGETSVSESQDQEKKHNLCKDSYPNT